MCVTLYFSKGSKDMGIENTKCMHLLLNRWWSELVRLWCIIHIYYIFCKFNQLVGKWSPWRHDTMWRSLLHFEGGQGVTQLLLGLFLGGHRHIHFNLSILLRTQTKLSFLKSFILSLPGNVQTHHFLKTNKYFWHNNSFSLNQWLLIKYNYISMYYSISMLVPVNQF